MTARLTRAISLLETLANTDPLDAVTLVPVLELLRAHRDGLAEALDILDRLAPGVLPIQRAARLVREAIGDSPVAIAEPAHLAAVRAVAEKEGRHG